MNFTHNTGPSKSHKLSPSNRPIRHYHLEPILFLADRMAKLGSGMDIGSRQMVDKLARLLGMAEFRQQDWYRTMTDQRACTILNREWARKGALVTLALVRKRVGREGRKAGEYFTRIRRLLGEEPISVPADPAAHLSLALDYLRD